MRVSSAALALAVASGAVQVQAAPLFGFGSLVDIIHRVEDRVESWLDKYGIDITPSTDADKHGPTFTFDYKKFLKAVSNDRYARYIAKKKFAGWDSYKAVGVNLGTWLEIEANYTPDVLPAGYQDEWSYCAAVGKDVCGPVLEKHYESFVTRADIDRVAQYGVNTLRIPTTYAAWFDVPGSNLYHGRQIEHFRNIAEYAIQKHGMHVVLGLHSQPGSVNNLQIGEKFGEAGWFYNDTNMAYSLQVMDAVLDYVKSSSNPSQYTIAPINEASDTGLQFFGSTKTVSLEGTNYLNTFYRTVLKMIKKKGLRNWMMVGDCFMGASYWAPFYTKSDRVVVDSHFYYFAAAGVYANYAPSLPCGQAEAAQTTLPVFVGEFSLQAYYNNSLALRQTMYSTQVYAWSKYLSGGSFWNIRYLGSDLVSSGEGGTKDYWSFMDLIDDGVVLPGGQLNSSFC